MTQQSIIEQLKANEKPFGLMSAEMKKKMHSLGTEYLQVYQIGHWLDLKQPLGRIQDMLRYTYRLRPDYEEEPEIEEWPIFTKDDERRYKHHLADSNDPGTYIDLAPRNVNFIGFKLEDGGWYDAPIKPTGPDGKLWSGNITVDDIVEGRVTIRQATHVLFRKGE